MRTRHLSPIGALSACIMAFAVANPLSAQQPLISADTLYAGSDSVLVPGLLCDFSLGVDSSTNRTPIFFETRDTIRPYYPATTSANRPNTTVYSGYILIPGDGTRHFAVGTRTEAHLQISGRPPDSAGAIALRQGYHALRLVCYKSFADTTDTRLFMDGSEVQSSALYHEVSTNPNDSVVKVYEPAGGAVYHVGDTLKVRWAANQTLFSQAYVRISFDLQETPLLNIPSGFYTYDTIRWGWVNWVITDSLARNGGGKASAVSDSCIVFVQNYTGTKTNQTPLFAIRPGAASTQEPSRRASCARISLAEMPGRILRACGPDDRGLLLKLWSLDGRLAGTAWGRGEVSYARATSRGAYAYRITSDKATEFSIVIVK